MEPSELTSHHRLALWAADCAERVIHLFEDMAPNDHRPRAAIEATRAWVKGKLTVTDARRLAFQSHAAAREVENKAAIFAARAAGHAAATAHVGTHAQHSAAYAIKAVAAAAEREAHECVEAERKWQLRRWGKLC